MGSRRRWNKPLCYLQPEDNTETKDTVEFTPKAVAEYLARTGEIDEFKELLNELVQSSEVRINFVI